MGLRNRKKIITLQMTNNLINLNDPLQFPVLQGINSYLSKFFPLHDLYYKIEGLNNKNFKIYSNLIFEEARHKYQDPNYIERKESVVQIYDDLVLKIKNEAAEYIERTLAEIIPMKMDMLLNESFYIEKTIAERDNYLRLNISENKVTIAISRYNFIVITKIIKFCNSIENYIWTIYSDHFTEDYIKKLDIKTTFRNWYDAFGENQARGNNEGSTIEKVASEKWKELIKLELQPHLLTIETKIESKITNWKQRIDLIECASFCQLLFDRNYFEKGSTNVKTVNEFSMLKYGIDVNIQLKSAKRKDRDKHKMQLKKHFS